jgi:hypothetical protein
MNATLQLSTLDLLLEPLAHSFTPEAARSILAFKADERTQALIDDLAEKANQGTLSAEERAKYETIVKASNLIAVLKAKARQAIAEAEPQ